jgi:Tetratricopeptide repeat
MISKLRQNNLASLYKAQGRYADSEPPFKRALAIREKDLVPIIRMSQWD